MDNEKQNLSLSEAAGRFLASLASEERGESQQEIYRLVRWFGWERSIVNLTPPEVAKYAERLSLSDTSYIKKFELIRTFLAYASKQGWCKGNLATHIKTKLSKANPIVAGPGVRETIPLTRQGYADLEMELVNLKSKRYQSIDAIRQAAADKDFRENAPLDAAREERGYLEGRIQELEETLKSAVIIGDEEQKVVLKAGIGDSIILCDVATGEELHYTIVSPREADPTKGKVSSVSPIGKAMKGRTENEIIEVSAPAGKLRYRIKKIER